MIVGKRQIILAALVLALGTAVALYWKFASDDFTLSQEAGKNYGDAQYVDNKTDETKPADDSDYFTQARLTRKTTRDEAVETLKKIMQDENSTDEQKNEATVKASALSDNIETEGTIENLVKAKGFEDCLAYIDEDSANVVVKTQGLDETQAAQIADIIVSETNLKMENISITEKP